MLESCHLMWSLAVVRCSTKLKMWATRGLVLLLLASFVAARPQDDGKKNPDSETRIGYDIDEFVYSVPSPLPIPSPVYPAQFNPLGESCQGREIWYQRNADGSCSICACVSHAYGLPSVSCLVCNAFCGGEWPSPSPLPVPSPYPDIFGPVPSPYPDTFGPEPYPYPIISPVPEPLPLPIPIPAPSPYPERIQYPVPSALADIYCPPQPPPIIIPGPPRPVPVPVPIMVPGQKVYIPVPVPISSPPEQIIVPGPEIPVPVDIPVPVPYPVLISVPVSNGRVPVIYYISPICRGYAPNVPFQTNEICVVFTCRVKYHYVYLEKQRIPNCGVPWIGGQGNLIPFLYKSGEGSEEEDSVSGASEPEERFGLPSLIQNGNLAGGSSPSSALANALLGGFSGGYSQADVFANAAVGGYLGSAGSPFGPVSANPLSGGYSQADILTNAAAAGYLGSAGSPFASVPASSLSAGQAQVETFVNAGAYGGSLSSAQALAEILGTNYPSGLLNGGSSSSALVNALAGGYEGGYPVSYGSNVQGGAIPGVWSGGFPGGFPINYPHGYDFSDSIGNVNGLISSYNPLGVLRTDKEPEN